MIVRADVKGKGDLNVLETYILWRQIPIVLYLCGKHCTASFSNFSPSFRLPKTF